jgi:DNA-binding transcriptional ArsR family regulator
MLRVHLGAEDLGRIRFADAPAPVLESVLMLFELRNRPQTQQARGPADWRTTLRTAFPAESRPLLNLAPTRHSVLFLDVLTPDAEQAFQLVRDTSEAVHAGNLERIARMKSVPIPPWLYRYAQGDVKVLDRIDQALRAFHSTCVAPMWSGATSRFHDDITRRMTTVRRFGVAALLSTLNPEMRLNGLTLECRYPFEREVRLNGRGLTLMPSAFWSGRPLLTWDPQDQNRHVLIYPASSGHPGDDADGARDALAALLGPTRAAVLRALRGKSTTTSGIAREVGISLPSASEHTATLRGAGLITSQRQGQAMQHHLTHLGHALLQ